MSTGLMMQKSEYEFVGPDGIVHRLAQVLGM
jgi:hypothetical protein